MILQRTTIVFLSVFAAVTGSAVAATQQEILKVLDDHGIPYDREVVEASAVKGILSAVDEGARIISSIETGTAVTNRTLVRKEEWAEGICYLKLEGLRSGGGALCIKHLKAWSEEGRAGLIMDIRGAGGADLESVDDMLGMFTATNTLLYTVRDGRGKIIETHRTGKETPIGKTPLMVLVGRETRGASELLAGSLSGKPGVMLLGSRTRGDARLRERILLKKKEILYIATKWLVLADDVEYDQVGIKPDIEVSETAGREYRQPVPVRKRIGKKMSDKAKIDRKLMERVADDPVLARATDIHLGLKALRGEESGGEGGSRKSEVGGRR